MEVDQHMGQRERTARGKKGDKGGGAKAGKYGKQGQWSQPGQWGQQGNWWNDSGKRKSVRRPGKEQRQRPVPHLWPDWPLEVGVPFQAERQGRESS